MVTISTPVPLVVMGVSGCGKSTVGSAVAAKLAVPFIDADDLHSAANRAKMSAGHPLTDEDRRPWLEAVGRTLAAGAQYGVVMACSALKRSYRDQIRADAPACVFVHLSGPQELIAQRLGARSGHFMPVDLLDSQYSALEVLAADEAGITLDTGRSVTELCADTAIFARSAGAAG